MTGYCAASSKIVPGGGGAVKSPVLGIVIESRIVAKFIEEVSHWQGTGEVEVHCVRFVIFAFEAQS